MVSSVILQVLIIEKNIDAFFLYTGCPECYPDRETPNPVIDKSMHQLYQDTMGKVRRLKDQGFEVKQMWECKLVKEMKHNEEMRRYFEEYDLVDPLQPRDAFYGGRTNAARLFYECQDDEEIR